MDVRSEEGDSEREEEKAYNLYRNCLREYENALDLDRPRVFFPFLTVPAILFASVSISYWLGRMGLGPLCLLPVLYFIGFVFIRRVARFKRSMEAFVYYGIRKEKKSKFESVTWMNGIMDRVWKFLEPNVSKILLLRINPILHDLCPSFIGDIRLDEFTLGSLPPVVEGIKVKSSESDTLIIDVSLHFVPAEVEGRKIFDQLDKNNYHWNSKITLTVRMGSTGRGIDMPFTLKNLSFKGHLRIKLKLTCDKTLVENMEVCFVKQPVVDFKMVPLKIMDIMDIPGLSTAVKKTISFGVSKAILYPKSISIAIKPKTSYYAGVLIVRIHSVDVDGLKVGGLFLKIGIDGKHLNTSGVIEKEKSCSTFYLPIKNTDGLLTITGHSVNIAGEKSIGGVYLPISDICIRSKVCGRVKISGVHRGSIDLSIFFIPKIDVKAEEEVLPKSAIVTLKVVQVMDISPVDNQNITAVQVRLKITEKERKGKKDPVDLTAAELMAERQSPLSSVNASSSDSEPSAKEEELTDKVLYQFKTKKITGTSSPSFDQAFVFFTRDTKRTNASLEVWQDRSPIGNVSINIRRGVSISYGIFELSGMGRVKLLFSAEYAVISRGRLIKYTHIRQITVSTMDTPGVYRGYVVTKGRVVPVDPFIASSNGSTNCTVYAPVINGEKSKIVLYKNEEIMGEAEAESGEITVGESIMTMQLEDKSLFQTAADRAAILQPEEREEEREGSPFVQFRVIVCKVDNPVFLEFVRKDEVVTRSMISSSKSLPGEFLFFEEVSVVVKTEEAEHVLGMFAMPPKSGRHEILLAHDQMLIVDTHNRHCDISYSRVHEKCIIRVKKIIYGAVAAENEDVFSGVFATVEIGDKEVLKTMICDSIEEGEFDEESEGAGRRSIDSLTVRMWGWSEMDRKKRIGEVEVPLLALRMGENEVELKMEREGSIEGGGKVSLTVEVLPDEEKKST